MAGARQVVAGFRARHRLARMAAARRLLPPSPEKARNVMRSPLFIERLRTAGIVAHVDAGKTTLTERILHATGRVHVPGSVDGGSTITDHDPRERARGITIGAAAVTVEHRGHALSLVDTPGHVDFGIEVERSLRVLDGAVVVLDAVSGVEPQTEAVWARADRLEIPRVVFVNKLDRAGADFDGSVLSVEEVLG